MVLLFMILPPPLPPIIAVSLPRCPGAPFELPFHFVSLLCTAKPVSLWSARLRSAAHHSAHNHSA